MFFKTLLSKLPLTWIIIGTVFLTLTGALYYLYDDNKTLSSNNDSLTEAIVTLQQNANIVERVNTVNEEIVNDFISTTEVVKETATVDNQKSITTYVNQITPAPQVKEALPDNGNARVSGIAIRMLRAYCNARPTDPQCNTLNTNN